MEPQESKAPRAWQVLVDKLDHRDLSDYKDLVVQSEALVRRDYKEPLV